MNELIFRQAESRDIDNLVKLRFEYVKADYGEIDAETEETLRTQLEEYFPAHLGKDIFGFLCFDDESGRIYGEYDPAHIPCYDGTSIDGIRVAFHKTS